MEAREDFNERQSPDRSVSIILNTTSKVSQKFVDDKTA